MVLRRKPEILSDAYAKKRANNRGKLLEACISEQSTINIKLLECEMP